MEGLDEERIIVTLVPVVMLLVASKVHVPATPVKVAATVYILGLGIGGGVTTSVEVFVPLGDQV